MIRKYPYNSILIVTLFTYILMGQFVHSQERIGGWGSLMFGKNKKASEKALKEICPFVYNEGKENIIGEECIISHEPFEGLDVDVSLLFSSAFFDSNRVLENIRFTVQNADKESLKAFYSYASSKWPEKESWKCNDRTRKNVAISFINCGATFSDNYVHLNATYMNVKKGNKVVPLKQGEAAFISLSFFSLPLPMFL